MLTGRCDDLVAYFMVDRATGRAWGNGCFVHGRKLKPWHQFAQRVTIL